MLLDYCLTLFQMKGHAYLIQSVPVRPLFSGITLLTNTPLQLEDHRILVHLYDFV